ncbi:hypothetical protein [Pontimicrobium sp. IMCC45349]|uniref:hypothetical protein n=1 Tax=Pontimicrobium sp. IMCC45349 TaxID=3391574 RepID=UPI0039A388CF
MNTFINSGKVTAIVSFIIGTIILILHIYLKDEIGIMIIGLYYTIAAFFINAILFLSLIIAAFIKEKYRKQLAASAGILLVNIPIAFIYILIVFQFNKW